jgi:hypothetical protein
MHTTIFAVPSQESFKQRNCNNATNSANRYLGYQKLNS